MNFDLTELMLADSGPGKKQHRLIFALPVVF